MTPDELERVEQMELVVDGYLSRHFGLTFKLFMVGRVFRVLHEEENLKPVCVWCVCVCAYVCVLLLC